MKFISSRRDQESNSGLKADPDSGGSFLRFLSSCQLGLESYESLTDTRASAFMIAHSFGQWSKDSVVYHPCSSTELCYMATGFSLSDAKETDQDGNHNTSHKLTSRAKYHQSIIFYWLHISTLGQAGRGIHSGMNTGKLGGGDWRSSQR